MTFKLLSRHNPLGHWWHQRLTAVVLVPLSVWLLLLLHKALQAPYAETVAWLKTPFSAIAIAAWTLMAIYHAALGVQVVIEDYVPTIAVRQMAIRVGNLVFLLLAVAALAALAVIFVTR